MVFVKSPKLTIGLPVYNAPTYLRQSIESLLGQSYGDFILFISDNASTDETSEICREYARFDRRVTYHRNDENIGMSPNFNLVAERCETPFLKWSTADDYWHKDMVAHTLPVIESDPTIALCYPKTIVINEVEGTERQYDDNLHMPMESAADRFIGVIEHIRLCNVHLGISRVAALRKTRMLKPFPGADLNLMAELALYGKIIEVPKYLFYRRFHEDSSSWAPGDAVHQQRRFHSAKTRNTRMILWRAHIEYFAAALRAPIPLADKRSILSFLLKKAYWSRRRLTMELKGKFVG